MNAELETVVAIPVRNEASRIQACLDALAGQTRPAGSVVLLLNNCTDASLEICRRADLHTAPLHIVECHLNDAEASAGEARRLVIDHALALCGRGVILTTDADAVVPASWVADNLAGIEAGVDCVCGMAVIAPEDDCAGRPRLEFDDMRERFLLNAQDEIATMADPDPYDPWPRHQQHSGASIAVRAEMLLRAGGAPRVAAGEDRVLVANLALIDARIRHDPAIQVSVSGRQHGRAAGGMAETIMRRLRRADWLTDETLEPTIDAYRRVLARRSLRAVLRGDQDEAALAADLCVDPQTLAEILTSRYFGIAWARLQRISPVLQRRRVAFADLARETRQALALRDELRGAVTSGGIKLYAE